MRYLALAYVSLLLPAVALAGGGAGGGGVAGTTVPAASPLVLGGLSLGAAALYFVLKRLR